MFNLKGLSYLNIIQISLFVLFGSISATTAQGGGSEELIRNGEFLRGLSDGWNVYIDLDAEATTNVEPGSFSFNIIDGGSDPWDVQLNQDKIILNKGTNYRLAVTAYAEESRTFNFGTGQDGGEYTAYGSQNNVTLSTSSQEYVLEFTMTDPTDPSARVWIDLGNFDIDVTIEKVSLTATGINISSPLAGETFFIGDTLAIQWSFSNYTAENVSIEFSPDNGMSWESIISEHDAESGLFNWQIPEQLGGLSTMTSNCRIKISDYDNDDFFNISNQFGIFSNTYALFDDFEHGKNFNRFGGIWAFHNDEESGGNSKIRSAEIVDGELVFKANYQPGYNSSFCGKLDYAFGIRPPTCDPHVGMIATLTPDYSVIDLSDASAISFMAKADRPTIINLQFQTVEITDYNWYHAEIPVSNSWRRYTVSITGGPDSSGELIQKSWGEQKPFNPASVKSLTWFISQGDNRGINAGTLEIDDVLVYGISQPDEIFIQSPLASQEHIAEDTLTIKWAVPAEKDSENFDIFYSIDSGDNWSPVTEAPVTGVSSEYQWEIPDIWGSDSAVTSVNCLIKIVQSGSPSVYSVSGLFTIFKYGPEEPEIMAVPDTVYVYGDTTVQISLTNAGSGNLPDLGASISRYPATSSPWLTASIDNSPINSATMEIVTSTDTLDNGHYMGMVTLNGTGVTSKTIVVMMTLGDVPLVSVTNPTAGSSFLLGTPLEIVWSTAPWLNNNIFDIELLTDGDTSFPMIIERNVPGIRRSLVWPIQDRYGKLPSDNCQIRLYCRNTSTVMAVSELFAIKRTNDPVIQPDIELLYITGDSTVNVSVTNAGGGTLPELDIEVSFQDTSNTNWLTATIDNSPEDSAVITTNIINSSECGDGVHSATVTIRSGGLAEKSFSVVLDKSTGSTLSFYNPVSVTGANMVVIIPVSAQPVIGGTPIDPGDEIAVFSSGGICAGAAVWNGSSNISITVWGNNSETPEIDGMQNNEPLNFRIWKSGESTDYSASAGYSEGRGLYMTNSFAVLSSLLDIVSKDFYLQAGWNLISFNIIENDMRVETIFGSKPEVIQIKNNQGEIYFPKFDINTIGSISVTEGYQIYMESPYTIKLQGDTVDINTPIRLDHGWGMISYLPSQSASPDQVFSRIKSGITLVKNNSGDVYFPDWGIDNIALMTQGQGYQIHMKEAATLNYSSVLAKKSFSPVISMSRPVHFITDLVSTGNNATVLVSNVKIAGSTAPDGSEIGVFGENGNLIGSGAVKNGMAAFTLWGACALSKQSGGASDGEKMSFSLWNGTQEIPLEFTGDDVYGTNKILTGSLSSTNLLFVTRHSLSVVKNRLNGPTHLSFSIPHSIGNSKQKVTIDAFDLRGRKVTTILSGMYGAGVHDVIWDGRSNTMKTSSKRYIIQMKTGNFTKHLMTTKLY